MPHFNLDCHILELSLKQPFTTARDTKETVRNVLVRLVGDGIEGLGEAAPNIRYGEDVEGVIRFIEFLPGGFFDKIRSPFQVSTRLDQAAQRYRSECSDPAPRAALAALEMAWLDWWARMQDQPLWQLWDAPSARGPVTSFTIGLDEVEVMQQKVKAAEAYPVLKVKLGTGRDREIIRAIREVTGKPIRVDANEGWKTLEDAKRAVDFLAEQNIELVEQPMPAERFNRMVELKKWSPLPFVADESFTGNEDLAAVAEAFDVVNIKLMKNGSLVKGRRTVDEAKRLGLEVMIGCMIESSLANTAGAVLSLFADYADLDGHLLIADDPFRGLRLDERKRITLDKRPGLGAVEN
ncbi:MAG: dipeptide epimerase [Balneolaceae bacterium]|nr:dipeptide epimerase [Balneolaceae bacterium]